MIVRNLDHFLEGVRSRTQSKVADSLGVQPRDYLLNFRTYGRDGVMGALEPVKQVAHEVAVVFEAFAPTQEDANGIASTAMYVALHHPVPEWSGLVTNLATTFSPATISRGPAYRFTMNHVVEPEDPTRMFRIEFEDIV